MIEMVFLEIIILSLTIAIFYLLYKFLRLKWRFEERVKKYIEAEVQRIREDAIKRSARTLSGKTLEKLVPFLDNFPYDPHDIRWLGDPVDLVVFDGYSKEKAEKDNLKQIVFVEVKSGDGELSQVQKNIKKLVENKKVKWDEFRIEK